MKFAWARLHATVLPSGEEKDLWIHDGLLRFDGPADAPWLARPGGYVLSGLVDCHSHLSWPHERSSPSHTPAWMNRQRQIYAELGTTLLRDMGSDRDDILRLEEVAGLPSVRATGRMILRDDNWPLTDTPVESLASAMIERVKLGASWVKVFADFSGDFGGRERPGFTGWDELTYPVDVLSEAVRAVHLLGARVAAHCFSTAGAHAAIEAGVDSLEHGWGIDEQLIDQMRERGTAWVPLVGIAPIMLEIASREGDTKTVRWLTERMEALHRLLPFAVSRNVRVFAGTDWFPNPSVADEIVELNALGVPHNAALAAGAWAAREWLGFPSIADGERADLVLFREDPRQNLAALKQPALAVIGGEPLRTNPRHLARHRATWAEARARLA